MSGNQACIKILVRCSYTVKLTVKNHNKTQEPTVTVLQCVCVDSRGYMGECKLLENRPKWRNMRVEEKTSDIVNTEVHLMSGQHWTLFLSLCDFH